MALHHFKVGALALAFFAAVSACERNTVPPSPGNPVRPQTLSDEGTGVVQWAIFSYDLPGIKHRHPAPPQNERGKLQV